MFLLGTTNLLVAYNDMSQGSHMPIRSFVVILFFSCIHTHGQKLNGIVLVNCNILCKK